MLAPLAALLLAAAPLDCPPGATPRGAAPPDDFEAFCEGRPDPYGRPRRHGPARTWYDDGRLRTEAHWREGTYRADARVGTWTVWYEDGGLEERGEWADDRPHGAAATWHRGGKRRSEGRFCLGVQCGAWTTWDEGGRLLGRAEFGEHRATP
ncbi:MAG: hypothetical protein NDI82_03060 [Anaeromyxobacteraceae bacterium]|nr:hypothetical protein [Anaeromyxobacteraceae bacterium]